MILLTLIIAAGVDNTELHIYGSGDFEEELKKICQENTNIKYFEVVPNDIVVKEQLKATLLVNLWPTNEECTKYSFPSKNMEYMVSGTPFLTTRLEGIPHEYYKYLYTIDDYSVESVKQKIKEILAKPQNELDDFGEKVRQFVLKNTNCIVRAKKIVELINNNISKEQHET